MINTTPQLSYDEFLQSKLVRFQGAGFTAGELNPNLFDFQEYIVRMALLKGRFAIFADCGLGKSLMQLDWADKVVDHTGKPVLILAPLAVSGQTIAEGVKFGVKVEKNRGQKDAGIYITNYEQLEHVIADDFAGVVLDESSILKNFTGVYKTRLLEVFRDTPYKLCCTATPSPNDVMELGNHSEFLGAMTSNEMLAMYFVHDGADTKQWNLKKHGEADFWAYVASWSVMLGKPQDLGFEAEGYSLPELKFIEKKIITEKKDNGLLFNEAAVSATNFNHELSIFDVVGEIAA